MAAMRQACGVQARPSLADRVLMIGIQYLLLSGLHEPDKQQGESPNATHNKTHEYIMSMTKKIEDHKTILTKVSQIFQQHLDKES